jgi:hypothetical protein
MHVGYENLPSPKKGEKGKEALYERDYQDQLFDRALDEAQ